MTDTPFRPVVYLLRGCPFCLKLRLFLLEAGLLGQVEIRAFDRETPERDAIVARLSPHFDTVGFPTVEVAPGDYRNESDALIAWFAERAGVDPATLPTYGDYASGVFPRLLALYQENIELKRAAA